MTFGPRRPSLCVAQHRFWYFWFYIVHVRFPIQFVIYHCSQKCVFIHSLYFCLINLELEIRIYFSISKHNEFCLAQIQREFINVKPLSCNCSSTLPRKLICVVSKKYWNVTIVTLNKYHLYKRIKRYGPRDGTLWYPRGDLKKNLHIFKKVFWPGSSLPPRMLYFSKLFNLFNNLFSFWCYVAENNTKVTLKKV